MKINMLMLSNMYPSDDEPGYATFVKNIYTGLSNTNAYNLSKSVIFGRTKSKPKKILSYLRLFFDFSIKLLKHKPEVIYINYLSYNLIIILFFYPIIKYKGIKLICNAHGEDISPTKRAELACFKLTNFLINRANLVIVPSEYYKQKLIKLIDNEKIFISPSGGIDTRIFNPGSKENLSNIDINHKFENINIGFASRIDSGKGWDILLDSLSKIPKDIKFTLHIAGHGAQFSYLLETIESLSFKDSIVTHGSLRQADLADLYRSLDLFIFPTCREAESLGLVGLEAMACKVPVIGSDIAGLKTYINHGNNGFLFKPGSSDDLARSIVKFINLSSNEKSLIIENAFKTAELYDSKNVISNLSNEIISSIGKKH